MTKRFDIASTYLTLLSSHRSDIIQRWMNCADVQKTLGQNGIAADFFAKYFALKVLDYALGVVLGKNKLGNCPVIGVMLVFFQKKNIPLEDVFFICVNLKNTLIAFMLEKGVLDGKLLSEVCGLIDHNFSGVIKEYLQLHHHSCLEHESCNLPTYSNPSYRQNTPCNVTTVPGLSASQYLQEIEVDYDVMDELAELEQETLDSLHLTEGFSNSIGNDIVDLFSQYAKMINQLVDFQELSYALFVLVEVLQNINFDDYESQATYLQIYSKAIINDLAMWRKSVFMEKNAEDIHYLDKTLLSSIAQLQILLSQSDTQSDTVEFF